MDRSPVDEEGGRYHEPSADAPETRQRPLSVPCSTETGLSSPSSCAIYALRVGADGQIYKIGRTSKAVQQRLRQIQTGSAEPLSIFAAFPTEPSLAPKLEAFVHASLWDLASAAGGGREFFSCPDEEELRTRFLGACEDFASFQEAFRRDLEGGQSTRAVFLKRRELAAATRALEVKKELLEEHLKEIFPEGCEVESTALPPLLVWKRRSYRHFDLDSFRKDHPSWAEQYCTTRVSRVAHFW